MRDFHDILKDLDDDSDADARPKRGSNSGDQNSSSQTARRASGNKKNVEDVYIAVMGVTGAGKSTFVQLCANPTGPGIVGHGMQGFTQDVGEFTFMYNEDFRIHLIDTPGFDDTDRKDAEVLRDVAGWLSESYERNHRVSGILYLHRISDPRMGGTAKRNLKVFMQLCGADCFPHLVLATTMWSLVDKETGERREQELVSTDKFWGHMVKGGSVVKRLHGDKNSAMAVLEVLLSRRKKLTLQIQHEIVDQGRQVVDTLAGQQVDEDLRKLQAKHQQDMIEHQKAMDKAIADNDAFAQARYEKLQKEVQAQMQAAAESRETLKADFEKLQKERSEELERIKNTVNEQVKVLDRMTQEKNELEERLRTGQGNPDKIERYLELYNKRLEKMEEEVAKARQAAQKKRGGVTSDFGNMIFEAMLPWPLNLGMKVGRYITDKRREEDSTQG